MSTFDTPFDFPFGPETLDPAQASQEEQDIFGIDLFFNGDLEVLPRGDYREIGGLENLRASIHRRFATSPGEYKLNPDYGVGFPAAVKKRITKASIDELRHRAVDNLSRERRIEKILEIKVEEKLFGNSTGLVVTVRAQAFGRVHAFEPFSFSLTSVGG